MSSLIQSLIDQHPEAFDRLFFIVRLGLFVYIAIGLYPSLRRHLFGGRNVHSSAPRPLNSPTVYNTQQAAHYIHTAQPAANAPRTLNTPAADNTQPPAQYLHSAQPVANAPQSANAPTVYNTQQAAHYIHTAQPATNAPRPLNTPAADNTQQAAHYTSQTQPNSLRIPSPEQFVAKLIRLYRASIINVRIGHSNLRIACIPALLILAFLFLFR